MLTWISIIHNVEVKHLHFISPKSPVIPALHDAFNGIPIATVRRLMKPLFSYHCTARFLAGITGHSMRYCNNPQISYTETPQNNVTEVVGHLTGSKVDSMKWKSSRLVRVYSIDTCRWASRDICPSRLSFNSVLAYLVDDENTLLQRTDISLTQYAHLGPVHGY